jgi:aminoglycoside 6-adenylyltransferase
MRDVLENDPIIQIIIQWARERDDVRATLLTSTRAIPGAKVDLFSDYDVILIVTDIYPYFEDRSWLDDFGEVLVFYRDPIGLEYDLERFAYITQYVDGSKIDFTLWTVEMIPRIVEAEELPDDLDVGYIVLLDKDHLTDRLRLPTYKAYIPNPPSESEYAELVMEFFHEATYVAKHLWREDLIPAKYNLDYRMKHVILVKMLQWQTEIDHGWLLKPGAYGKGLRKYLRLEIWSKLEETYVGADIEENWRALLTTIELFRTTAIDVADGLGYLYPFDLDERVMVYLCQAKNINRELGA